MHVQHTSTRLVVRHRPRRAAIATLVLWSVAGIAGAAALLWPGRWTALTLALKRANFRLLNRAIVHAENPTSVHIANLRALIHDAILVLAPAESDLHRGWPRPVGVDKTDSRRFCQDCASVLGWMLDSDMSETEIAEQWLEMLGNAR